MCRLAAAPLGWLPERAHATALSLILNRLLARSLQEGELDFLENRAVAIHVSDLGIEYRVRLARSSFVPTPDNRAPDVRFSGDAHALLLLATRQEDPDTLFFQRRLRIEGNTALGLNLKNFLDAMEVSPLPAPIRSGLDHLTRGLELYCVRRAS